MISASAKLISFYLINMGSIMTKYGECTGTTVLLLLSLILACIGFALIFSIVGIVIGLGLIIAAGVIFFIALGILINMLIQKEFKKQNNWCKANIVICGIVFIIILSGIIAGSVKHVNDNQPANPDSSNESTTIPSQPSP